MPDGHPAPPPRIDVHHHVIPPRYLDALQRAGRVNPIAGVDYPQWALPDSLDLMDRHHIAVAMLSITDPGVHFLDGEACRRLAREVNEDLAELVREHPHRFGGFAVLPLPDVDGAMEELEYALDVLQLDGVGLMTNYRGVYPGDPELAPVLRELDRRQTPVFVHPASPARGSYADFGLPVSLYEFTFDTTRMVANLLYSRTLDDLPDLKLILPHAGGAVPYLAKRLTYGPTIAASTTERSPIDAVASLQRLYYDVAMSASPFALPSLQALVGPEQVLLGTDFPFMPESTTVETIEGLECFAGFGDDDLSAISHENAVGLFPRLRGALPAQA